MAEVTIKRTGSWIVELQQPLVQGNKTIDHIEVNRPRLDNQIRWEEEHQPTLALLSELCGVSEPLLRQLTNPDVDTVLLALYQLMPASMRTSFEQGTHPFSTPRTQADMAVAEADVSDQQDSRWSSPPPGMAVRRFSSAPKVNIPQQPTKEEVADDGSGMNLEPPAADIRAIG